MNILVCDDEKEIVDAIEIYLLPEGHRIFKAYDGIQALQIMKNTEIHLVLLDIMMPHMYGIHTTLKIREQYNVPIIILSAKSEDADKVVGLNVGADDYITKPFNSMELIARVKSQLRRYTELGTMKTEPSHTVYVSGGLMIDDDAKRVTVDGEDPAGEMPEDSESAKKITLEIKNMSEYPLNFSAEELTERFVRGDLSRSSQGSGLGLEIAKNLTLLQGGTFDIVLDGDLFKVVLTFLPADESDGQEDVV